MHHYYLHRPEDAAQVVHPDGYAVGDTVVCQINKSWGDGESLGKGSKGSVIGSVLPSSKSYIDGKQKVYCRFPNCPFIALNVGMQIKPAKKMVRESAYGPLATGGAGAGGGAGKKELKEGWDCRDMPKEKWMVRPSLPPRACCSP